MFKKLSLYADDLMSVGDEKLPPEEVKKQQKTIISILFLCASVNGAILACEAIGPTWLKWFHGALGYVWLACGVAWCSIDARAQGHRLSSEMTMWLMGLLVIAFPVYMFKSKGREAGGIVTAKAIGVVLASLLWLGVTQTLATIYLAGPK